jgi:hypothetical protein
MARYADRVATATLPRAECADVRKLSGEVKGWYTFRLSDTKVAG